MKTARIYDTLKTVLNEGDDQEHTVEVRLFSQPIPKRTCEEMFHQVWVDGILIETSNTYDNEQRAYVEGRKAWRRAITVVLNQHWPLPE